MDKVMRINISLLACFLTFLEVMLAWIPMKLLAAQYAGRSSVADAALTVL